MRAGKLGRQTGDLLTGVQLKDGGRLRIESNCVNVELPEELPDSKADNRILRVCSSLR